MTSLSYTICQDKDFVLESSPRFQLLLDGQKTIYYLVPAALECSLKQEGVFPICTCSCGVMACGGVYVKVVHDDSHILWEKLFAIPDSGDDEVDGELPPIIQLVSNTFLSLPLNFDKQKYKLEVEKLLIDLKSFPGELKAYKYDTKQFTTGDYFRF